MVENGELLKCEGHLYTIEKEKVIDLGIVPDSKEKFVNLILRYGKDFTIPMTPNIRKQFPGNIIDIVCKMDLELFFRV